MPAEQDRRQGPREAVQLNGYCVNSVVPCSVWALKWLISTCTAPNQALPVPPLALPSYYPSQHTHTKQDSQWSKPFYEQAFLSPVKTQNWAVTGSSCLQQRILHMQEQSRHRVKGCMLIADNSRVVHSVPIMKIIIPLF